MSGRRGQAEDLPQARLLPKSKRRLRTSEACTRIPLIKNIQIEKQNRRAVGGVREFVSLKVVKLSRLPAFKKAKAFGWQPESSQRLVYF